MKIRILFLMIIVMPAYSLFGQADTLITNEGAEGQQLLLQFEKGEEHNHPLMAVWIEDLDSNYIETLYVAKSIATSIFTFAERKGGKWQPGIIRRPAALPYWSHKRGIEASDGLYLPTPDEPLPDAITGPTPQSDFVLISKATKELPQKFRILFEINQSWDWNEYWSNSKFPEDEDYKTSSQPSIIYEALIDLNNGKMNYTLYPIGHGHYSGKNGNLYTDLSTLTTAREIVGRIVIEME